MFLMDMGSVNIYIDSKAARVNLPSAWCTEVKEAQVLSSIKALQQDRALSRFKGFMQNNNDTV